MQVAEQEALGKYQLVRHIATGGMAEVFQAHYQGSDGLARTCVVKRLLPHFARDPDFIEMFRNEARISLSLSHANFVQVFDVGQQGNEHFLAMEYVQGQNMAQVLRRIHERGGLVPRAMAFHLCCEVALGLHYAHSRRDAQGMPQPVVHRDVTPDNILVSYGGDIKLADFGIAKAASSAKTKAGFVKGKASYLSPEQVLGQEVDGRADVFALGAVLWEMLTGRRLFSGNNELEIINKVVKAQLEAPSSINAHVHYEIDEVVMVALQRNRDMRYQSAEEFRLALQRLMGKYGVRFSREQMSEYVSVLFETERQAEEAAVRQPPVLAQSNPSLVNQGQPSSDHPLGPPAPTHRPGPTPEEAFTPHPAPQAPATAVLSPSQADLARDASTTDDLAEALVLAAAGQPVEVEPVLQVPQENVIAPPQSALTNPQMADPQAVEPTNPQMADPRQVSGPQELVPASPEVDAALEVEEPPPLVQGSLKAPWDQKKDRRRRGRRGPKWVRPVLLFGLFLGMLANFLRLAGWLPFLD